ncbi:uncharacterized protein NEMAJ01_1033 [Nematocida major]|uniref:uncharacterized protein n=1 Tax=Nematocida major TaxID=1912982 RepID=UPI00200768DB|nr:uncharacterized protein NEMAJ01_1033 [Nematocida major]KAH9386137.1 hypothetical protein NEMAJ01_1033 [Nematocida major]
MKLFKPVLALLKKDAFSEALVLAGDLAKTVKHYKIHVLIGFCHFKMGNSELALTAYREALSLAETPEALVETHRGIAKIFLAYNPAFIDEKTAREAENTMEIALSAGPASPFDWEMVSFLLELHLNNDLQKFLPALELYQPADSDSWTRKCALKKLQAFHRQVKVFADAGNFFRERGAVRSALRKIVAEFADVETLWSTVEADPGFFRHAANEFLFFLYIAVYCDGRKLSDFSHLLLAMLKAEVNVSEHALVFSVVSDFLDFPVEESLKDALKSVMYNTLSPTVMLLRGPERPALLEEALSACSVAEEETGLMLSAKKDVLRARVHLLNESIYTDRKFPGYSEASERVLGVRAAKMLLEAGLSCMNVQGLESVLQGTPCFIPACELERICTENAPENVAKILAAESARRTPVSEKTEKNKNVHSLNIHFSDSSSHGNIQSIGVSRMKNEKVPILQLLSRLCDAPPYKEYFQKYAVDSVSTVYFVRAVEMHMCILQKQPETVRAYLSVISPEFDAFAEYVRRTGEDSATFSELCAYYGFLWECSRESLFANACPESAFSRHKAALSAYTAGYAEAAVEMLTRLHRERPYDYYVACDLGAILHEVGGSLSLLDEYLRVAENLQDTGLLRASLRYHQRSGNWGVAERRCQEILLVKDSYAVKMALAEALSQQKKFKYAVKVASEAENAILALGKSTSRAGGEERIRSDGLLHRGIFGSGSRKNPSENPELRGVEAEESRENSESAGDSAGYDLACLNTVRLYLVYLLASSGDFARASSVAGQLRESALSPHECDQLLKYEVFLRAHSVSTASHTEETPDILRMTSPHAEIRFEGGGDPYILCDAYVRSVHGLLTGKAAHTRVLECFSSEDPGLLLTASQLLLFESSAFQRESDPNVHGTISQALKKVHVTGESPASLETALLLAVARGEAVCDFYAGDRQAEASPFARALIAFLSGEGLDRAVDAYLPGSSVLELGVVSLFSRHVSGAVLERARLHLSRDSFRGVGVLEKEKNAPDGD